jgi:hypothetical protein
MTPPERLLELAALLEAAPAGWPTIDPDDPTPAFDMDGWGECRPLARPACRTTCCAVGLAGLHPPFQAEGFAGEWRVTPDDAGDDRLTCTPTYEPSDGSGPMRRTWHAVERFFGLAARDYAGWHGPQLSWDTDPPPAARAFYPACYAPADRTNPKAVAARLRRLAAGDPVDDWAAWKSEPVAGDPAHGD